MAAPGPSIALRARLYVLNGLNGQVLRTSSHEITRFSQINWTQS